MGQVLSQSDLNSFLQKNRENKKVVFTNGCFDILHIGHVRYLQDARAQGDLLIVAINSDSSVKKLKGDSRPVQTEKDRAEILSALECVDFVSVFEDETPLQMIKSFSPDVLVKGGDWPIEKIVGSKEVLENGGEVKSLQFVQGQSTTGLIEKILKI